MGVEQGRLGGDVARTEALRVCRLAVLLWLSVVAKGARMPKQQGGGGDAGSHSRHMEDMFHLFMRSSAGEGLRMGNVGLNELYAVYCAGFTEGVWTERVHPGRKKGQTDGR